MNRHPLVETLMVEVLSECFQLGMDADQARAHSSLIPHPVTLSSIYSSFLGRTDVLFLHAALPERHRNSAWRRLFDTADHGRNFGKLAAAISHQGPTLVIVKGGVFLFSTSGNGQK